MDNQIRTNAIGSAFWTNVIFVRMIGYIVFGFQVARLKLVNLEINSSFYGNSSGCTEVRK
jgi:hypothetical protein